MRRVEVAITVTPSADAAATRTAIEDAILPFVDLWKHQPAAAPQRQQETWERTTQKRLSEMMLGRTATEQIMAAVSRRVHGSCIDRTVNGATIDCTVRGPCVDWTVHGLCVDGTAHGVCVDRTAPCEPVNAPHPPTVWPRPDEA